MGRKWHLYAAVFQTAVLSVVCHDVPRRGGDSAQWNASVEVVRDKLFPAMAVIELVLTFNWTLVNVYSDSSSDKVNALTTVLARSENVRFRLTTKMGPFKRFAALGVGQSTAGHLHVVICEETCVANILSQVAKEASPTFLHTSKWLLVTPSVVKEVISSGFENIAVVSTKVEPDGFGQPECQLYTLTIDGEIRMFTPVRNIDTGTCICGLQTRRGSLPGYTGQHTSVVELSDVFPNPQHGLNGRTLRVGVAEWSFSLIKKQDPHNSSRVTYDGFAVDVLNELQRTLNFRIEFIEPVGPNVWGVLFAMLKTKKIEVLGVPSVPSINRQKFMDFTFPVSFGSIYMFYKRPTKSELKWRAVLDAISWPAVALILGSLLFTSVILGTFEIFGEAQSKVCQRKYNVWISFILQHVLKLFGNLLKQGECGCTHNGEMSSVRLVFASWCVFCLVLTITVTAYLIPALGIIRQPILFRTLKDLMRTSDYTWGMYGGEGVWYQQYFQETKIQEHRDLFAAMIKFNMTDPKVLVPDESVHVRKMSTERYAYLSHDLAVWDIYTGTSSCDITYIGEKVLSMRTSFPLIKDSPYTRMFSEKITDFYENGQMELWISKWVRPKKNCNLETTSSDAMNLDYVQSVFFLLSAGLLSSVAALSTEMVHFWCTTRCVQDSRRTT